MRKVLLFLGYLDDVDLEWMIDHGVREKVPEGSVIIAEGEPVDRIFFVLDGEFKVTAADMGDGDVARLKPGEVVGEMSFLDSRPPSATVTALVDSHVGAVSREPLLERLESDDGFASRFYRALATILSDRLRVTISHLGYGEEPSLEEEVVEMDEISPEVMDIISMAGVRFSQMRTRRWGG